MKRPLFWSVVGFALGEVTFFYTEGIIQISIIIIMLICCAFYSKKRKNNYMFIIFLMYCIGNIWPYIGNYQKIKTDRNILFCNERYCLEGQQVEIGQKIDIEAVGVIDSVVLENEKSDSYKVKILSSNCGENNMNKGYFVVLYLNEPDDKLFIGDTVRIRGRVKTYDGATNPGQFSSKEYYNDINIAFFANEEDIEIRKVKFQVSIANKCYYLIKKIVVDTKIYLENRLKLFCDENTVSLYEGILFGDKSNIDDEKKDLFKAAGIAHILAISGLHISVIGGLLYKRFRKAGVNYLVSGTVSIVVIALYGIMTGNSIATIRAIIMLGYFFIAEILGVNCDTLTSLAVSAFVILIYNAKMICNSGLLLSFSAMFAIVLANYIMKNIKSVLNKTKRQKFVLLKILSSVIFTLSISAITFPFTVNSYYEYPIYSWLTNLFVVPLMFFVIISGICSVFISFVSVKIAKITILPGKIILEFFDSITEKILKLPWARINFGPLRMWQILIYYSLIFAFVLLLNEKNNRKIRKYIYKLTRKWLNKKQYRGLFVGMLVVIFTCELLVIDASYFFSQSKVIFLDVGQGDGILIHNKNGINIVVDGGSSNNEKIASKVIVPALKYHRMARVDYWFVSHLDNDHISGLMQVLNNYFLMGINVKCIVLPKYIREDETYNELVSLAKNNNIEVAFVDEKQQLSGKDFLIDIMHPDKEYISEDKNDMSLCMRYQSEDLSILFTGDIGIDAMEAMANKEADCQQFDIVKIPHHGSKNSLCLEFYNAFEADIGIVSCGRNNRYGHPDKEIIDMMNTKGIKVYRTDQIGAITISEN